MVNLFGDIFVVAYLECCNRVKKRRGTHDQHKVKRVNVYFVLCTIMSLTFTASLLLLLRCTHGSFSGAMLSKIEIDRAMYTWYTAASIVLGKIEDPL